MNPPSAAEPLDALILGAGMSGLAMASALKRAGRHRFAIVEKSPGLGGTWWDNRYPGAHVDVPAPLYSFSFAPHARWQRRFAGAPEILAYQQQLAEREGLLPHLRLNTAVTAAVFDEVAGRWRVTLDDGSVIEARCFVCSAGPLSVPRWPAIEGLHGFAGALQHSARWHAAVPLAGQRIGVIGTGSTASQLVPELAKVAAQLTVFQRTPNWVLPRPDRRYRAIDRVLFHLPGWNRAVRLFWALTSESFRRGFEAGTPAQLRLLALARLHFRRQLRGDTALVEKLMPSYPIGCKRIVFSNEYLRAFTLPQVRLETGGIERITERGVRLKSGEEHPFDVLVCATGFDVEHSLAVPISGRGGATLQAAWAEGPRAHLGTTVAGFPNLFLMLGPNTATGHTSTLLFIEPQVRFVLRALEAMERRGTRAWLDVRGDVMQAFDSEIQRRLEGSVWMQCSNWYRAASGRNVAIWPGYTLEYRRRLAAVDFARDFMCG
jgi:cation diffusion facilitator CzcD-associated flavoprotein CzcO